MMMARLLLLLLVLCGILSSGSIYMAVLNHFRGEGQVFRVMKKLKYVKN